jgi:MinD superfamily P-loop ATPase
LTRIRKAASRIGGTPARRPKIGPFELGKALEHLTRSGVRLAVIDTPPAITESISYVIGHADLVILPTRPSPHDLRAIGPTVDIANRHGKPVLFVVNAGYAACTHHWRSGCGAIAGWNGGARHDPSSR